MSELMKKNAEVQNLLEEVDDIAISDVSGASGKSAFNATLRGACGRVPTVSAECSKTHRSCAHWPLRW